MGFTIGGRDRRKRAEQLPQGLVIIALAGQSEPVTLKRVKDRHQLVVFPSNSQAFGLEVQLLPMCESPAPTRIVRSGAPVSDFEEYLVRDGAPDDVEAVDLSAAARAAPATGVLESLEGAQTVLICPSNPVVSIGPILAVSGLRDAIRQAPAPVVAVSPIIGGAPVKGPADRLLRGIGVEVSARGVARLYREIADGFVLDRRDADQAEDVERLGLRTAVLDTLMRDTDAAARLAGAALRLAGSLA